MSILKLHTLSRNQLPVIEAANMLSEFTTNYSAYDFVEINNLTITFFPKDPFTVPTYITYTNVGDFVKYVYSLTTAQIWKTITLVDHTHVSYIIVLQNVMSYFLNSSYNIPINFNSNQGILFETQKLRKLNEFGGYSLGAGGNVGLAGNKLSGYNSLLFPFRQSELDLRYLSCAIQSLDPVKLGQGKPVLRVNPAYPDRDSRYSTIENAYRSHSNGNKVIWVEAGEHSLTTQINITNHANHLVTGAPFLPSGTDPTIYYFEEGAIVNCNVNFPNIGALRGTGLGSKIRVFGRGKFVQTGNAPIFHVHAGISGKGDCYLEFDEIDCRENEFGSYAILAEDIDGVFKGRYVTNKNSTSSFTSPIIASSGEVPNTFLVCVKLIEAKNSVAGIQVDNSTFLNVIRNTRVDRLSGSEGHAISVVNGEELGENLYIQNCLIKNNVNLAESHGIHTEEACKFSGFILLNSGLYVVNSSSYAVGMGPSPYVGDQQFSSFNCCSNRENDAFHQQIEGSFTTDPTFTIT